MEKERIIAAGKVLAVCTSPAKGTQKTPAPELRLRADWGAEGDAHAGPWHRQISLLAAEKIEEFRRRGVAVDYGAFGENIVVEGLDLRTIPVGTQLRIGTALLELTQIGKECHSDCAIRRAAGDCIMPREGVFARVLEGGAVKPGDTVALLALDDDRPFTAAVVTLSDKGAAGEREDQSGPLICGILTENGYEIVETLLLSDDRPRLEEQLKRLADRRQVNVIFTTGGTGFSPRDITPEATAAVCDRMAPGIAEAMRYYSLQITPRAMLSRQTAGIRGRTLIVNMPGSPKACREDLSFILPELDHGLSILRGTEGECGSPAGK